MITAQELREVLDYDPETGVFRWRVNRGQRVKRGDVAGTVCSRGYRRIFFAGKNYLAHRVAWLLTHGAWPRKEIDHVNGDGSDNRIANLREAAHSQNMKNRKRHKNNSSGFKGVEKVRDGKWRAIIQVDGRRYHLGTFGCPTAAYLRRLRAEKYSFDGFTRLE